MRMAVGDFIPALRARWRRRRGPCSRWNRNRNRWSFRKSWATRTSGLLQAQLEDGSWPALPGQPTGCWVTSLAARLLRLEGSSPEAVNRGIEWVLNSWPAEGGVWWRIKNSIYRNADSKQDLSLRGWNWTPGTASWVEPTAHALLLLRALPGGDAGSARGRAARTCRADVVRPHVSGRRVEQRQSADLRSRGHSAHRPDGLGPDGASAARGSVRSERECRVARTRVPQNSRRGLACACGVVPFELWTRGARSRGKAE